MFLGYQNNKVVIIANTKEELLDLPMLKLDKIEPATERWVYYKGEYIPKHKIPSKTLSEKNIEARIAAYPSIEDQLDMLYWDGINNTKVWEATISKIKRTYPKD